MKLRTASVFVLCLLMLAHYRATGQRVIIGAKHFTEGYILSEILAQYLESSGVDVERRYNLGGTMICFSALVTGDVDVYPEYTGTISAEILKNKILNVDSISREVKMRWNLGVTDPLGFNNTYALVMKMDLAHQLGISSISDLKKHSSLHIGLSYEFLNRNDGWKNLAAHYALSNNATGLEHGLAYDALTEGKIDITDAYSTDGEIGRYNLLTLKDDTHFFPDYQAVYFFRNDTDSAVLNRIRLLAGKITEREMQRMNAAVTIEGKTYAEVAAGFLTKIRLTDKRFENKSVIADVLSKTGTHIFLTLSALMIAAMIGIPLALLLHRYMRIATPVLYFTGLLQTIPSIALLAILIPIAGIGAVPAVIALFLYALLPIVRSTLTGLRSTDPLLLRVAEGMGMTRAQKMRLVELPLSMPMIISGLRTAAVINVGTATLAAFIGAGGLGEFIVTGLALNNTALILRGAIPAALLAVITELLFELLEKRLVPVYLRKKA